MGARIATSEVSLLRARDLYLDSHERAKKAVSEYLEFKHDASVGAVRKATMDEVKTEVKDYRLKLDTVCRKIFAAWEARQTT